MDVASRDSEIAAALEALVPSDGHFTTPTSSNEIMASCEALAAEGTRPTVRAVYAHMMAEYGKAPSFRDLSPVVRTWRAGRWKSSAVRRVFQAYQKLDAEQKEAFRELVETGSLTEHDLSENEAIYEVSARLRNGLVIIEDAGRKTHAWVKYYQLRDRYRGEADEITIKERNGKNADKVVKQWIRNGR